MLLFLGLFCLSPYACSCVKHILRVKRAVVSTDRKIRFGFSVGSRAGVAVAQFSLSMTYCGFQSFSCLVSSGSGTSPTGMYINDILVSATIPSNRRTIVVRCHSVYLVRGEFAKIMSIVSSEILDNPKLGILMWLWYKFAVD